MKTPDRSHRLSSRIRFATIIVLVATFTGTGAVQAKPDKGNGNGKGDENGHGNGVGQNPGFIPPGHRRAPVEVIVVQAPPALRVEVVTARPSAGHVWVSGYWVWSGDAYVWSPSVWVLPPEPAAVWVAPRFEERSGVHVSISGFWKI